MMRNSAFLPGGGESFTFVGNVAPPKPTIPHSLIFSIISFESSFISFSILSERSIVSTHSSPSTVITTALQGLPARSKTVSMPFTVPDTLECTGAEMNPFAFAIS